ncbi:MAG: thiolase family protein [Deltaproteobacteria bacterium]|nr:thiolase family protein [Deltaproteobacteria bacterium]
MGKPARNVAVIGIGMTKFGKHPELSLKDLAREAGWAAIRDAGVDPRNIEVIYCGNSVEGLLSGQEDVRGQVVMREMGLAGKAVINTPNACASSSTSFREAWLAVASGVYDIALAVGFEKLYIDDTAKTTRALASCTDVMTEGNMGVFFPGMYAMEAKRYMHDTGCTREHLAKVAVKNHRNGCLNPHAQIRHEVTIEEVLNSKLIADPLTLYMCSPIGDGGAAAILCAGDIAAQYRSDPVFIASSGMSSGAYQDLAIDRPSPTAVQMAAQEAYEIAGIGPEDIDLAELHDAFSPAELIYFEELGFCPHGEAPRYLDEGRTEIGGAMPINTSGGLECKGHPVGATGLAMIHEVVTQLRGHAGPRQVRGPKVGLVQNGGGLIGGDAAAMCVHILKI